jgi:hypothetical protein
MGEGGAARLLNAAALHAWKHGQLTLLVWCIELVDFLVSVHALHTFMNEVSCTSTPHCSGTCHIRNWVINSLHHVIMHVWWF